MVVYLLIGCVAFLGAIIQTTMGFGGAVLLINVMPFFFPVTKSVALVQGSVIIINIVFTIIYFKKIRWDVLWPALIPGIGLGVVFSIISISIKAEMMTILLGLLFIVLSIYYLIVVNHINIIPSKINGFLMGAFSGFTNAFFGLAGPPVALYLVPSINDKIEYFASSQVFFLLSSIACISVRLLSGIYEASDVPIILYLMIMFILGSLIGINLLRKIEGFLLKKIIYIFIGLNGIYLIAKQFLF